MVFFVSCSHPADLTPNPCSPSTSPLFSSSSFVPPNPSLTQESSWNIWDTSFTWASNSTLAIPFINLHPSSRQSLQSFHHFCCFSGNAFLLFPNPSSLEHSGENSAFHLRSHRSSIQKNKLLLFYQVSKIRFICLFFSSNFST